MAKKGDWSSVGEGVNELRFLRTGPGWRVYFHETNQRTLILLLFGGDKSSQKNDINKANDPPRLEGGEVPTQETQNRGEAKLTVSARIVEQLTYD